MDIKLSAENWAVELEYVFSEVCMVLGVLCGVVVIFSEEEGGYVEKASFGYGEEGFFYEFLTSEGEEFKKVTSSNSPIIYSKQNGVVSYNPKTKNILVSRIYQTEMQGFVLTEVPFEIIPAGLSWILAIFSEKLAQVIEGNKFNNLKKLAHGNDFRDAILELVPKWMEKLDSLKIKRYLYLVTEKGKLKNRIIQHFHDILQRKGELLYLSYLPEQIGKFEKSLLEWMQIASEGTLVIEGCSNLETAHQRIFFEKITTSKEDLLYIFWDEIDSKNINLYHPFQKLLQENVIKIPQFSMIESEKRLFILKALFIEVCNLLKRKKIQITQEALQFLDEKAQESELGELSYVLEETILKCRGLALGREELEKVWKERTTLSSLFDLDDLNLRKSVEAIERQKILLAHRIFSGNQLRMAKALGISRGSLQYKMKQMGI